jgi:hypothetical protein
MGGINKFIMEFRDIYGSEEKNILMIRKKAQRAKSGNFRVRPLSFFKRVLSVLVVLSMVFTTRISTFVSYANEISEKSTISKINLDDNIAVQHLSVGEAEDSIIFPSTLKANIDTYEEVLVEVVEDTTEEDIFAEDIDVQEPEEVTANEEPQVNEQQAVEESQELVEETEEPVVDANEEIPTEEVVEPASEEVVSNTEQVPSIEEAPAVEATPVETAPVESAPVESAPAPAEPVVEETDDTASIINVIVDALFPAIIANAEELEVNQEPIEEDSEVKTVFKKEYVKTTTEITLKDVQWSLDTENSTSDSFDSSVAGATYIYKASINTEYELATALPTITVIIVEKEIEEVAFDATATVDGIVITVNADKGVFPEGATLSVKRASADQAEAAEEAVEDKEDAPIVEAYSFDISILNEEGLEIQPDNSKGKVTVSFALEEAANDDLNTEVYHMDEQVDGSFEAEKLDSTSVADIVTAETTGFSVYTVAITGGTVTFENDGYPYGKNMGDTPTLSIRVTNANAIYKWQSSTNKTSWTDISGATSQDYTFTPASGTWYRCVVNGAESKAVQMVKPGQDGRTWTNPMYGASWYITNGKMAYSVNGNSFDVTGLYIKDGTSYMIQTTYGGQGWRIVTSDQANPSAGSGNSEALEDLQIAFNDNDEFAVIFMADLQAGQKGLSFGTDTMIASWDICEFSDSAALEATLNGDNTLKQVSMIGANSSNDAADDDPAFVIAPITKSGLKFWVGGYSSRQNFSFASGSDSIVVDGQTIPNIRLKCNGIDSGMTMSWSNVPDGRTVSFQFAVGDVASTGAVEGNVNYFSERIEGLTPGVVYTITEVGTNNTYTKTADANGGIDFTGKDNNNKSYDFTGKTLNFSAVVEGVNLSATMAVAGRPVATEADTTGTADNSDATKPAEVGKDAVVSSTDSVTLNISVGDTVRMAQEYRIYDKEGNPKSDWISPNTNGTVKFNGLTKESDYTIKARIPAKQNAPASIPTAGVPVKTIGTIDIEAPSELTTDYNGNANTYLALSDMEGVEISYSTDPNANYASEVPTFTMPGIYTVYYKATKEGYRSTYGSYQVIINKIDREEQISVPEIKVDTDDDNPSMDLGDFIGDDDTASVERVTGDIRDYIYNVRIVDNVLTYDQRESNEEKSGNIVIKVENPIYRDNEVSIPITLPPAIQIEEPQVKTSEYTGDPVDVSMTTPQEDVTIKYSLDPNGEFTEEMPEITNAGDYTIYYQASRPGKTTRQGSYNITIDKKEIEDIEIPSPITIPNKAKVDGALDLSAYMENSAQIVSFELEGQMVDYITINDLTDGVLNYSIPSGKYALNGNLKLTVVSDNFEEYVINIPLKTAPEPVVSSQSETRYYAPVIEEEVEEETQDDTEIEDSVAENKSKANDKENAKDSAVTLTTEEQEQLLREKNIVDKEKVFEKLSEETKTKLIEKLESKGGEIVQVASLFADESKALYTGNMADVNSVSGKKDAAVDEDKIPVNDVPVALVMGEGAVIVTMELSDNVKTNAGLADAKSVAKSILTKEQYGLVASGSIVEIKVEAIPLENETVSEVDKKVIEDGAGEYAENLPNLTMGNYIDISMYMRVDDSDWNQITETEQFEIVIVIPEEYRGKAETYYIMRAHEGVSTLLEDLDDDPNTITIATGQFSTYALMFDQTPVVAEQQVISIEDTVENIHYLTTAALIWEFGNQYWMILLAIAALVVMFIKKSRESF